MTRTLPYLFRLLRCISRKILQGIHVQRLCFFNNTTCKLALSRSLLGHNRLPGTML